MPNPENPDSQFNSYEEWQAALFAEFHAHQANQPIGLTGRRKPPQAPPSPADPTTPPPAQGGPTTFEAYSKEVFGGDPARNVNPMGFGLTGRPRR